MERFSFIFFTLNPNEWSSSLTLKFCGPYTEEVRDFSLELGDEEMTRIYGSLERGRRTRLLLMSVEDVVASTNVFGKLCGWCSRRFSIVILPCTKGPLQHSRQMATSAKILQALSLTSLITWQSLSRR